MINAENYAKTLNYDGETPIALTLIAIENKICTLYLSGCNLAAEFYWQDSSGKFIDDSFNEMESIDLEREKFKFRRTFEKMLHDNESSIDLATLAFMESTITEMTRTTIQKKAANGLEVGVLYYYRVKHPKYFLSLQTDQGIGFVLTDNTGVKVSDRIYQQEELALHSLRPVADQSVMKQQHLFKSKPKPKL